MTALPPRDRFFGCMLGSALGDALGEIAQHRGTADPEAIARDAALAYTDDTAMSLGVAEFLCGGKLSRKALGDIFLRNLDAEPWRGYGGEQMVYRLAELRGLSYEEARRLADLAFRQGAGSRGDGAAMRIAPVGLAFPDGPALAAMADLVSGIDHGDPVARDAAFLVALAVSRLSRDAFPGGVAFLGELAGRAETDALRGAIDLATRGLEEGWEASSLDEALGNVTRSTIDADKAVPFALYAFAAHPGDFRGCMAVAIGSRGDADTIGAIAGALCGALLGLGGLPQGWLGKLEGRELIEARATALHERYL